MTSTEKMKLVCDAYATGKGEAALAVILMICTNVYVSNPGRRANDHYGAPYTVWRIRARRVAAKWGDAPVSIHWAALKQALEGQS